MRRTSRRLRIATFRADVTPPPGSPLCGGWIKPVADVADPLHAIGVVVLGEEAPIVLCAVDWCEICNDSHAAWRQELAGALGTAADRVAVHTVHQHNAPIVDQGAQRLVESAPELPDLMAASHARESLARTAEAARDARGRARVVTHLGLGSAAVREVASARRIVGSDGKVRLTRWSASSEPELRAEPEGLVDPLLRTVAFLDEGWPLVMLHYYATHPMSFYGDGIVTADFAGLARERRRAATPGCERIYFSGCGGNITAGKYNDGSPGSRASLTARMERAMEESERSMRAFPIPALAWETREVLLPPREDLDTLRLEAALADPAGPQAERKTAALRLAYLRRRDLPVTLSCLRLGADASILHLPGEPFVEYQLFAASRAAFVGVAAYGDTGTGYIPLAASYAEGGYEVGASAVSGAAEGILKEAIRQLLHS